MQLYFLYTGNTVKKNSYVLYNLCTLSEITNALVASNTFIKVMLAVRL